MSIPMPDGSLWDVPVPPDAGAPDPPMPVASTGTPTVYVVASPPDAVLLRYDGVWRGGQVVTTLEPYLLDALQRSLGGTVAGVVVLVQE